MSSIRKKRNIYAALQVVLSVALVGGIVYSYSAGDTNGPEIVLADRSTVLSGNMTDEQLIAGVVAQDDVDLDVSDTLKIESVTKITDDRVLVVYAAKDKSNNVSTMTETAETDGTFAYKDMIEAGGGVQNLPTGDAEGTGLTDSDLVESAESAGAESAAESGVAESAVESQATESAVESAVESEAVESAVESEAESAVESAESEAAESAVESATESAVESETTESAVESETTESTESAESQTTESTDESVALTYDSEMSTEDSYRIENYVNTAMNPSAFTESDISKLNENLRQANNMSISRLPDGYPVIRLNTYAVKKSASESFSPLGYISDIRDDVDPVSDIFGRISVSGNTGLDKPGIYTVNYYVTDSQGNRSNVAHLVVVVS